MHRLLALVHAIVDEEEGGDVRLHHPRVGHARAPRVRPSILVVGRRRTQRRRSSSGTEARGGSRRLSGPCRPDGPRISVARSWVPPSGWRSAQQRGHEMTATLETPRSEPVELPPDVGAGPPGSGDPERAEQLGLPSATALVVGSIIGTGVFTMPAVMAGAGTSSIITLGVIAVGRRAARPAVRPADQAGARTSTAASTPTPATSSVTSPAT